jgi:hypothetical protein
MTSTSTFRQQKKEGQTDRRQEIIKIKTEINKKNRKENQ